MKPPIPKLNRFTTLPVLMDLLQRKKLVLLSPEKWEDRNDAEVLLSYQKRKRLGRVLALCFSHGNETIHHWKAFSDGISGCCIEFDGPRLQKVFDSARLRHGKVAYKKVHEISDGSITFDQIPFTKRYPYRCEEEYRVILEDNKKDAFYDLDVTLDLITKITINQRMPDQVYATIKDYLRGASGNKTARVNRSTLYENRMWLAKFSRFNP